MNIQPSVEDILAITSEWDGERFNDGRPRVPDSVLANLRAATIEQVWSVLQENGYHRQFEAGWLQTRTGHCLVGRAVTAQFVPHRPDLDKAIVDAARRDGRPIGPNKHNWMVVESLLPGDVMVVDIFGKIHEGTVIGDNLGSAIATKTGTGAVIDGGIRDLTGIQQMDTINIFCRGVDPTPIRNVTLAGMNIPTRVGSVTVLPGDVVLGTPSGVIFIPPHLATRAAAASLDIRSRDAFGKLRLRESRYTSSQIDVATWDPDIESDYQEWLRCREHANS